LRVPRGWELYSSPPTFGKTPRERLRRSGAVVAKWQGGRVTASAPDPDDHLRTVEDWVADHLGRGVRPGPLGVVDVTQAAPHPTRDLVACTVHVRRTFAEEPHRRVALVALDTGRVRLLTVPFPQSSSPSWSRDGRLAVVGMDDDGGATAVVLDLVGDDISPGPVCQAPGFVETCSWSRDGSRLALLVASPGAEISDVYGSGLVGGGDRESWRPRVLPHADASSPGRVACVWDPGEASPRQVSGRNVWELEWCGDDALLALTSEGADENAWYAAVLTRLDVAGGTERVLHEPPHQLAQPRCSPDGRSWSVLSGVQSDRGLPAGALLVSRDGATPSVLDTSGVYVNDHRWVDATTILLAGLRGLDTVVARVDVSSGELRPVWTGPQTCGELQPEVAGVPGRPPVVVLEDHLTPPTLGVLDDAGFRPVLAAEGDGTRFQAARAGETTRLSWPSSDGLRMEGLLTVPGTGSGPHALVVNVHGGPTHAWRSTWSGRDPHTSALVARGYAVLRPNPRGSTGRGPEFVEGVYGDMGGLDVDDVVSGVRHLVDTGVADPARLGITGISYGGFMAAWVPCCSGLFAAAVARSPATDWVTQTLTSNIAEFDRLFVQGDPFDPVSSYVTRSPLHHQHRIRTPMLLTAGLQDLATPPSQAQVLYSALARRGAEAGLVLYPEEGHGVRRPDAVADQVARMVAWFERFMPASSSGVAGAP
jgi:dipeptidyl aminopeptidase/acylaminoacyl peptidase